MKLRTIIELRLVMSGRYDIPGQIIRVKGTDAYGKTMHEHVPAVDVERLNRDVDAFLKACREAARAEQEEVA